MKNCLWREGGDSGIATGDASRIDLPERRLHSFSDIFPLPSDLERPWNRFVEQLRQWQQLGKTLILSFASQRSRRKFLALAMQDGLSFAEELNPGCPGLYALISPWRQGAELPWANTLALGEDVIQPRRERRRVKSRAFTGLERYDGLKPGDHLVHRDFGIGRFEGLHNLKLGDYHADFLLLIYADDAKFYLPVDRLSLVQRFKGADGLVPPLDKLGGSSWQTSKSRAQKAVEQIAQDLVEMYAWRRLAKGYSYGPVNELLSEFEASFGFEETPDQARAIEDVLDDMDRPEAMDRLVCGDVGFGKTEVALRAAFRAAAAGKQVALLCPTTVLAEQHYKTFNNRLSGFGLNVGLLSRFVSRKEQQAVLDKAGKGMIDVLIGTHRLLSGDVKLPNLSLLILDEEQRFGVRHKEKLKQFRKNIDVLTLSATPIPRTLQLSIAGLRGLSIIETAPPERKPVLSSVVKREDDLLAGVIARELERDGQVFWVHNRVQGIERIVDYVQKLAPAAKIGLAHGQMPERQLEESMRRFWNGETQILVCTAIVESGLDFPRANTLVVDGAQMFGLGQLYQLRGRVGRSDRQAYAVFVAPQEISGKAGQFRAFRERLRVILDMDYLGAGFHVAMEDLRIRGAGNILGEAQSGHMARVGLELYLEMLEDAVNRLRGDKQLEVKETELSIAVPALIPANYIADSGERLNYYKALSSAPDARSQQDVELEIRDRYGPLPEELVNFISILGLKRFLSQLQVVKADIFENRVKLVWMAASHALDPEQFVQWVASRPERARVLSQNALEYALDMSLPLSERLLAVCNDMRGLLSGGHG
ncbi:MAG: transcription-repair coupling factor [Desulfovibrionaceae bacterium]|nr:transcription-repair coupling factor [Desulfovibrionaceae bacterium]